MFRDGGGGGGTVAAADVAVTKNAHRYRINVVTSSIQNGIDNVLLLHVLTRIGVLLWLLLSATIWFYNTHTHTRPYNYERSFFRKQFHRSDTLCKATSTVACVSALSCSSLFILLFTIHAYFSCSSILFIRFHLFRLRITSHQQTHSTRK